MSRLGASLEILLMTIANLETKKRHDSINHAASVGIYSLVLECYLLIITSRAKINKSDLNTNRYLPDGMPDKSAS